MSNTPETDELLNRLHDEFRDSDRLSSATCVSLLIDRARSLERRLRQCDTERAKWKEWTEEAQYDCMAYRGALGEPIPESHDGRLSDGTTPMNYLVNWIARERDAALREGEELREALKFYAAEGSWQDDPAPDPAGTPIPWTAPIWGDEGQRARAALAEKGKP